MNRSQSLRMETAPEHQVHRSGWLSFAGYMLVVAGVFHAIAGLVALFKSDLYITTPNHLLVFSYTPWGWTHLIFGALLMVTAGYLLAGKTWARVATMIIATLSAIVSFAFIWAYPLAALLIIALDILVIYGVAMHGNETEEYE